MNKLSFHSFTILLMLLTWGCTPISNLTFQQIHAPAMAEHFQKKADQLEKKGELHNAIYALKVADSLTPGSNKIEKNISKLKSKTLKLAEHYYHKGSTSLDNNMPQQAGLDLMKSLRYHPTKTKTTTLIENYHSIQSLTPYTVKKGDTFQVISIHFFSAPNLSRLIADYNNLQENTPPKPGTTLLVPLLDNKLISHFLDINYTLETAQNALQTEQYEKAINNAEKVHESFPENNQAKVVINEALLRKAEELIQQEHFLDALAVLEQVTENYKDTESKIVKLHKRIRWEAENHYKDGVKYFVKEQLNLAIREWNRTLELNPEHPKALSDLQLAKSLLARLENLR